MKKARTVFEEFFYDVKDNFTIMNQEPFGPLVPILSFKDFDEVVKCQKEEEVARFFLSTLVLAKTENVQIRTKLGQTHN